MINEIIRVKVLVAISACVGVGFGLPRVSDVCVCWCGAMRSGLYDLKKNYCVNYNMKLFTCSHICIILLNARVDKREYLVLSASGWGLVYPCE